jgi:hypothetical protein
LLRKLRAPKFDKKLLRFAVGTVPTSSIKSGMSQRQLIAKESAIGRQLFGSIPKGHHREFFCLDKNTWIWYESWVDKRTGRHEEVTTRYEVHPEYVMKVQDGQPYQELTGQELHNFTLAVHQYYARVAQEVYGIPITSAA